tara:strand:- start:172 stop:939 length:768 start_codon:yes stop_codon:yes gene_type:complete
MAKQVIGVGTTANDGTGDPIRDAFVKVNSNFTELYTDDAGDVGSITATAPIARDSATGAVTISLNNAGVTFAKMQDVAANSLLIRNANSSGVLTELALATTEIMIGDGTGMIAAALSGDVTMANTGAVTIANDAVEHAMLENRYTAKATSSATGNQNIDASAATSFLLTGNVATATLTIQNMKLGQVIDIQMTGTLSSAAITLATDFSSTTINKVGTTDFDTAEKNVIQIVCVDDTDAAAIINYAVAKLTIDTTP